MLEIGLVGCPNAGKSTFFKAATLKDVKIASYPFTTLEPNEGLAYVAAECPCRRLGVSCNKCTDGVRFVPFKLWDVAGLVPDAHKGRGRGNAFLDDIMQASALIHILDASGKTDSEGNPAKDYDASRNIKMLESEIDYWIMGLVKKDFEKISRVGEEAVVEDIAKRLSGLGIRKEHVDIAAKAVNEKSRKHFREWGEAELFHFAEAMRRISKPMIIAANKIDAGGSVEALKSKFPDYRIIPVSAEVELALREAHKNCIINYIPGSSGFEILKDVDDKRGKALAFMSAFLKKYGSTGVQNVLNTLVFDVLNMIVVYPVENEHKMSDKKGNVLPDAFLMNNGATALDLAYRVHEDIGKKFIAAVNCRTGKNVSSDYRLRDGDIISIKSGK